MEKPKLDSGRYVAPSRENFEVVEYGQKTRARRRAALLSAAVIAIGVAISFALGGHRSDACGKPGIIERLFVC